MMRCGGGEGVGRRRWALVCVCVLCVLGFGAGCGDDGEADGGEAATTGVSGATSLESGPPSLACPADAGGASLFASEVVSWSAGPGADFGHDAMPGVVLGPPEGGGALQGGLDVVSLGEGGELVVTFEVDVVDCPGPDFVVFENAFETGARTYAEVGQVWVSQDGESWIPMPCALESGWPFEGCAGVAPVLSTSDNGVTPYAPEEGGGDAMDLADAGVAWARYVRIVDRNVATGPSLPPSRGVDVDALVVLPGHGAARR